MGVERLHNLKSTSPSRLRVVGPVSLRLGREMFPGPGPSGRECRPSKTRVRLGARNYKGLDSSKNWFDLLW